MDQFAAGAAAIDISPRDAQFLFGYPHVPRYATGIHDPLLSTALYLTDGRAALLFISNDVIFVTRQITARVRRRISEATGIPGSHIMVTATHTHSGPKTVDYVSNDDDPAVPKTDPGYVQLLEDGIVEAALRAWRSAAPAELGLAVADGTGVGTNRRDPDGGPYDPAVPVLLVRSHNAVSACMVIYSMHPTVLHEDSTLVSADFPGMARAYLQGCGLLSPGCPVLYHTGPAGNQSVRHVTRANTFAEAERLGGMLGEAIARALPGAAYTPAPALAAAQAFVDLARRRFPAIAQAEEDLTLAAARLAEARASGAPPQQVRRAEVDWFGAEETLALARAEADGRLAAAAGASLPAEVQVFRVGPWSFVAWPGEIFVEHALAVKQAYPGAFVISLANGELQGYIATEDAARAGGYEVSNAVFAPRSGQILVETALALLRDLHPVASGRTA